MPRGRARAFGIDDSGLAAIEFAFVLPLMLAIYLGIVELSNGLSASRKVDLVAHAMSDLTGQITGGGAGSGQAAITDAEMQQIFLAGAALIAPLVGDAAHDNDQRGRSYISSAAPIRRT